MINIVNIGYISFWQLNMACCTVKWEHHTLGFCGLNIATGRGSLKCLRHSIYFAWNVGKCGHKQPPYELPGAVLKWQLSQTLGQINCTCTRTPCPWGNFVFCLETGERRKGIIKWICHMYDKYIYIHISNVHPTSYKIFFKKIATKNHGVVPWLLTASRPTGMRTVSFCPKALYHMIQDEEKGATGGFFHWFRGRPSRWAHFRVPPSDKTSQQQKTLPTLALNAFSQIRLAQSSPNPYPLVN